MTEEEHQGWEEAYIEWQYKQYCKETETPLSMEKWLESLTVEE